MAGSGKTALSKRVSKAQEVKKCFSYVIFLMVSHTFNLTDMLKSMSEVVYGEDLHLSEHQAILEKLQQKLNGSKYLLVLDDVWDTFDWEPFRKALQTIGVSKGTTLLVTTREKKVVTKMNTYVCDENGEGTILRAYIYRLNKLSEVDSWSLFMSKMNTDNLMADGEKYTMAKRMLKKCDGVPLAIEALGGLLMDQNINTWKEIEESDIWEVEDIYGILPSLKLSFQYLLDPALKKCFSYCAIFGEDEVIEKKKLIQMWMAQGFLHPGDEMERIGEKYLNILLNSSLFQEVHGNLTSPFKMHDLVLALARFVSKDECWNMEGKMKVNNASSEVRHLSTNTLCENRDQVDFLDPTFCQKLRTYYNRPNFVSCEINLEFLKHSKKLRVLCLCGLRLKMLPESVGNLKHLRYLDLSGNDFETFPKVITRLYHLQTLWYPFEKFDSRLNKDYKGVGSLVNLRHLCVGDDSKRIGVPEGLSCLTALQTLPAIDLNKDWGGRLSDELGPLTTIVSLSLSNGEADLNLENFRYLRCLSLFNIDLRNRASSCPNYGLQSCKSLEELVIDECKIENYPDLSLLTRLRVIGITACNDGRKTGLETIGLQNLPGLRALRTSEILPKDLATNSPFCKSLYRLDLEDDDRETLFDQLQYLATLQSLDMRRFKNLNALPDWLGKLTSLKELTLVGMPKLECFPSPDAMKSLRRLQTFRIAECPLLEQQLIIMQHPPRDLYNCSYSEESDLYNCSDSEESYEGTSKNRSKIENYEGMSENRSKIESYEGTSENRSKIESDEDTNKNRSQILKLIEAYRKYNPSMYTTYYYVQSHYSSAWTYIVNKPYYPVEVFPTIAYRRVEDGHDQAGSDGDEDHNACVIM